MADNTESKTSVADIAATLLIDPAGADTVSGAEEDELEDGQSPTEGSDVDDLGSDETGEADQEQDDPDTSEEEEGAEEEDDEGDQQQIVDIDDEDVVDVMIDGKLEQRTIGELKKAASGEGAIERRLQEATELRKAAHAERTTLLEDLHAQEQITIASFQALDATAFKEVISKPDPAKKAKNPSAYLAHLDLYEEDQKRISTAKKAVQDQIKALVDQRNKRLKEYGEAAAPVIAKLIPELSDPAKAPKMLERLVATAKAYGYTEQEIGAALDPRMFHLVRDAMRYRAMTDRSKESKTMDLSSQGKKVPRKLRSGNSRATTVVAAAAKQQEQARKTAASTGKVKDVAATLFVAPKGK